jgi:lipoprotein-anchoring transpeptidase ErfK/SrfK
MERRLTKSGKGIAGSILVAFACACVLGGSLLLADPFTPGASAQSFTDVRTSDWFQPAVEALSAQGVISGYPDGTFRPYNPVTRAQLGVMIAALLDLPASSNSPFSDVKPGDWYAEALGALYDAGIIQGGAGEAFNPLQEVQRQQAATFIVRTLAYRNTLRPDDPVALISDPSEATLWLAGFKDRASISAGHSISVANAMKLGFISGYDDARFYPFVTLSRAQAAGMLYAALVTPLQPRTEPPQEVASEGVYPTMEKGDSGPLVAWFERRLAALSYRPGSLDGRFDAATSDAVMAFQKVEGLSRTGVASDAVIRKLISAQTPTPRKNVTGKRVEVDLTRQVLMLIDGGSVQTTIPIASGRAGLRTPTGTFSIERKLPYWRKSALGLLYKPAYFHGGYAIHGSYSVPASPASHGCVRVAVSTMDWLYPLLSYGMRVDIYY